MIDYAGPDAASRKLAEIEAAIATLKSTPHEGSLRDEIAPSLACHSDWKESRRRLLG
ncbi:hypothetical protein [Cypionkella sp.]|uniref:hypothetical protein n=1 Tax=Cypionkella sp. TaxID=2811411 RepID=UPI00271FB863|nr:hypothetical protein [Cypionkella sp.]MDO8985946.1 hypothetical protein [Cypionkella sp.]MDP2049929.1 hypothetical protein [Cypionkella sp.]